MNTERTARPPLRGLIGFNVITGILLGIVGFYFGWWLGHQIHFTNYAYVADTGQNDIALFLAYLFFVVGFLAGLGFLRYPLARMIGREPSHHENEEGGIRRYFGLCTDHKVIGLQYLVGIGLFFFIGGVNAMLIRAELLRPSPQLFGAGNYLTIVSLHGAMMMGIMTSGVLGPFANYFVPLMIGAKRMAFPRIESLTFWLLMAAGAILTSAVFFGGLPTGWTGYGPLNDQANMGMDSYIIFFILVGVSMTLLGLNLIATIVTMRAPGLTWGRLPIFCWGALSTSGLMVLAAPVLAAVLLMVGLDRTAQTSFFQAPSGGSPYLFENLFWFFGHPEVYVLALPGFGILLEILPVFARKPLWGYRLAVAGMLGVALLSFFVWQHHLFVSGINSALRPFYMLSTEVISIPTGFIFLCGMATLWRATHPLHGADALLPGLVLQLLHRRNLGGIPVGYPERCQHPRQLLRHGPLPLHDHGRPDLHVLRGDLLLGAEDDGVPVQRETGEDPLLVDVHRLQLDLWPAVRRRAAGDAAASVHLRVEPPADQHLGVGVRLRPRVVDAGLPGQRPLLACDRPQAGGGEPVGLQVARVAAADAGACAQLRQDSGDRLGAL